MVIKSTTAHIFHVGDTRIYRLRDSALEQLTDDHRLWVSREKSYLGRALGVNQQIEIDYQTLKVETGDIFLFATDGVYEHAKPEFIANAVSARARDPNRNLDMLAKHIADEAFSRGSADNLTIQIVTVDALPSQCANEIQQQLCELPFPPELDARMVFEGYKIIRELHASSRSHVYLAVDEQNNERVVIKTPATDLRGDSAYLERLLMEEWIARRFNSAHVLKAYPQSRKRNYLYIVTEFIEGQTLAQWMIDHPKPDLKTVRGIIEQIAKGLQAFHRSEMVHQDIRPANIMIDGTGTVRIIDFGSTRVAGVMEIDSPIEQNPILGTEQYSAPEYFLGESGSSRSDIFSLGVITYQMLTGELPYGTQIPKSRTRAAQRRLKYRSAQNDDREIQSWVDEAIKKAVHPDPYKRYGELSEFTFDLHHPNPEYLNRRRPPLLERHPEAFWKAISLILAFIILMLLSTHPVVK
jgi:serine/threonine protein kinase